MKGLLHTVTIPFLGTYKIYIVSNFEMEIIPIEKPYKDM